jgi:succinyl-diaminopimelate desuccinylase
MSPRERQQIAALDFTDARYMKQLGVKALGGEEGYTTLERRWARPTCDINGLTSGYQGVGAKTVLPAKASAKFSFRLVPDQEPSKIQAGLREMLTRLCPPGIEMDLVAHHGARAVVVPLESPYMDAAAKAVEKGFGKAPVYIREGGSIPVVSSFKEILGVDTLLLGWGLDDDNTHSPNEKFCLADFHRGIRASAYLWDELSRLSPGT